MSAPIEADRSAAKTSGGFGKVLRGLFMRGATVAAIDDLADRFRLVTLTGTALRRLAWSPGQKIQIGMGSAFTNRTYTPIDWDSAAGRTRILGYAHGAGPGSTWLRNLTVGDACEIFGPRGSLDMGRVTAPLAIFGDETSIGLAHAITSSGRADAADCCFELSDIGSSRRVLAQLGLQQATSVAKREDETHVGDMEAALSGPIAAGMSFVLTGKATTIQRLRQSLKRQSVSATRIHAKAYWAPGKQGLD